MMMMMVMMICEDTQEMSLHVSSSQEMRNKHSNALAYVTRRLIGQRQKFATVYSAIYCRKSDVIT